MGEINLQEKSVQSKTRFKVMLIAFLVLLFSITMTVVSVVQIVKINQLNKKIEQQEREIEDLSSQYNELLNNI